MKARTISLSSATRIFAIALLRPGGRILCVRKSNHHVDGVFRRRDKAAAEVQLFAGIKDAAARERRPCVNFLPGTIPGRKPETRDLDSSIGDADNRAFND